MTLHKRYDEITQSDIQELLDGQVAEGRTLDYKRDVVGNTDDDKREFRADVSSFANAQGGHIVFGVDEADGIAVAVPGVKLSDPDAEILRLEAIIRDSIQPRIPNIGSHAIRMENGNYCLVVRIPKSWAMPHAVLHKKYMQFFARTSNGKYQLDVPEIKAAFLLSDSTTDRIRQFRIDRLSKVVSDAMPVPLDDEPKIIYHCVPVNAFGLAPSYNLSRLVLNINQDKGMRAWGHTHRYNFDGLLFHNTSEYHHVQPGHKASLYSQVFHNGIFEAMDIIERKDAQRINGFEVENMMRESLPLLLSPMQDIGIEPPVFVIVSAVGVSGLATTGDTRTNRVATNPIDRDVLLFPEVLIEDMNKPSEKILKPVFDGLWNALGEVASPSYDKVGNWDESRRHGVKRR